MIFGAAISSVGLCILYDQVFSHVALQLRPAFLLHAALRSRPELSQAIASIREDGSRINEATADFYRATAAS
jgi:hypothetical protein